MRVSLIDKVLKKYKKKCYCDEGEGTFYGDWKNNNEHCAWCEARIILQKTYNVGARKQ
jgi:hypothetical protein